MNKLDYNEYVGKARHELARVLNHQNIEHEFNDDMFSSFDVLFNAGGERCIGRVKFNSHNPHHTYNQARIEVDKLDKMNAERVLENASRMFLFMIYSDEVSVTFDLTDYKNWQTVNREVSKKWGSEEKVMKKFTLLPHSKGVVLNYAG